MQISPYHLVDSPFWRTQELAVSSKGAFMSVSRLSCSPASTSAPPWLSGPLDVLADIRLAVCHNWVSQFINEILPSLYICRDNKQRSIETQILKIQKELHRNLFCWLLGETDTHFRNSTFSSPNIKELNVTHAINYIRVIWQNCFPKCFSKLFLYSRKIPHTQESSILNFLWNLTTVGVFNSWIYVVLICYNTKSSPAGISYLGFFVTALFA